MKMQACIVQMDIELGQTKANWEKAWALTVDVGKQDIILLPELWSTGYDLQRARELAEELGGPTTRFMAEVAKTHAAYVGGSVLVRQAEDIYNTFLLLNPAGELIVHYEKLHLFGLMDEHLYLTPGQNLGVTELPWCKAGLSICYDLRFPELYRRYADLDVSLLLISAEWPHPRLEHWRTLLRARAIENQSFVLAANRVGRDRHNEFFGHSLLIDPWGEIEAEGGAAEQVISLELEIDRIVTARQRLPVLADRRRDLPMD